VWQFEKAASVAEQGRDWRKALSLCGKQARYQDVPRRARAEFVRSGAITGIKKARSRRVAFQHLLSSF
jgi:hypothetical protein